MFFHIDTTDLHSRRPARANLPFLLADGNPFARSSRGRHRIRLIFGGTNDSKIDWRQSLRESFDIKLPLPHYSRMKLRRKSPLGSGGHILRGKGDVTHLLILRFQQLLSDGLLSPGAKLPPERELAANFGVARSSLRQALKVLEIMGVLTQKVGDGSYLNKDASSVLAVPMEFLFLLDDTSVEELTELRLMIEPALAAKAAERATSSDLALLRQSINDLKASKGDRVRLVASDLLFHRTIFNASGNRLTGRLFHTIHRGMLNLIMLTSQLVDLEHTLSFHKPILAAIEARNPALAAKLMTAHLRDAAELLMQGRAQARARAVRVAITAESAGLRRTGAPATVRPGPIRRSPVTRKTSKRI
jgi:GntR family transcriptional regulator, transcriptional repressor for pyruvate dehydrogenase complex